ncbi:TldD/PmbA family protein [Candidatus Poriferisodalis sp.]|uniref:TldD/PmbA family protein n=1 Tax=Candidatus Poriferisodalis sp. TaxID=3101277 RepID=UPI003D151EB8
MTQDTAISGTHSPGALVDLDVVDATLRAALDAGGEWAELFAEDRESVGAIFDEGRVEEMNSGRDRGVGIRVTAGDVTGYAHTADLSAQGLTDAARTAAAVAAGHGGTVEMTPLGGSGTAAARVAVLPASIGTERKVALLRMADDAARSVDSAITQVTARYAEGRRRILVANTNGLCAADDQVRTLFSVGCVASGDGGLQTGRETVGYTVGWELFDTHDPAELARRAASRAVTKLAARPAPSGEVPVVIARGGGGVLFHEACGHGLEADLVRKGASVFAGRVGEQVAAPGVTLVDDGTMGPEWGTLAIDDEGHLTQRNVLISDGVLTDYMWDWLRSRDVGRAPSGNGRRQSYTHLPMVRMTNTFVTNGEIDPDDIIADTPWGVYVAQLGGGQVNTATGDFVFGMTEAYLIEDGVITEPLREGNLIGNGPAVLAEIDAIGNDFAMGSPGTCGKDGQGVPVGDGQPTLRVRALTVGGTAA